MESYVSDIVTVTLINILHVLTRRHRKEFQLCWKYRNALCLDTVQSRFSWTFRSDDSDSEVEIATGAAGRVQAKVTVKVTVPQSNGYQLLCCCNLHRPKSSRSCWSFQLLKSASFWMRLRSRRHTFDTVLIIKCVAVDSSLQESKRRKVKLPKDGGST